jgi:hypothetical protein
LFSISQRRVQLQRLERRPRRLATVVVTTFRRCRTEFEFFLFSRILCRSASRRREAPGRQWPRPCAATRDAAKRADRRGTIRAFAAASSYQVSSVAGDDGTITTSSPPVAALRRTACATSIGRVSGNSGRRDRACSGGETAGARRDRRRIGSPPRDRSWSGRRNRAGGGGRTVSAAVVAGPRPSRASIAQRPNVVPAAIRRVAKKFRTGVTRRADDGVHTAIGVARMAADCETASPTGIQSLGGATAHIRRHTEFVEEITRNAQ